MAIFKCKMCGGTLEFEQGATVAVCDYCGTKQTLPRLDDERRANLYDRANHFRRNNDYDKAAGIYEKILNEDPTDAEAYWSLVLCRYGIEYVEDPATHKRVPTVNRAQFTSIFDDGDYKSALQYADAAQRALYEAEAGAINEIQKGILSISQKEEPFDVFICYKETDANGRRTPDSVLATDLYHQLTQEGFKVFFARITLEDKLGTAYEPYIFAALNSAKVMVVLGTKPEYFNAVWVKNEWSRYLALVKQSGGKKTLIPAYRDMDPYDLPEEFSHLQAQDMSKLGFMQDLIRGIKKIVAVDVPAPKAAAPAPASANAPAAQPLIDRGFMALEDGEWKKADDFFEQALNLDARNGDAYLGKFLVSVKRASLQSFLQERGDQAYIEKSVVRPQKQAFSPDGDALIDIVKPYVVPGYLKGKALLRELSQFDVRYPSKAGQMESYIAECRGGWASNKDLLRAKQYGKPEIAAQVEAFFEKLNQELSAAKQADAETVAQKKQDYAQFVRDFQISAAQRSAEAKKQADADAVEKARFAEEAERQKRLAAQIAKEKTKKRKKLLIAAVAIVIVAITALVLTVKVFVPIKKYNAAIKLYESGRYNEAISAFEELDGFKDSSEKISEIKYNEAVQLMKNGQYSEAISLFETLGDYKDSKALLAEAKTVKIETEKKDTYTNALNDIDNHDYESAYQKLKSIKGYKDVDSLLERFYRVPCRILCDSSYDWSCVIEYSDNGLMAECVAGYSDGKETINFDKNGVLSQYKDSHGNIHTYSYSAEGITETAKRSTGEIYLKSTYDIYGNRLIFNTLEKDPYKRELTLDEHHNRLNGNLRSDASVKNTYDDEGNLCGVSYHSGNLYKTTTITYKWLCIDRVPKDYEEVIWRNIRLICEEHIW